MVTLQKNLMQKQMDELLKAFATGKQSAQLSVAWIQSCRLVMYFLRLNSNREIPFG